MLIALGLQEIHSKGCIVKAKNLKTVKRLLREMIICLEQWQTLR